MKKAFTLVALTLTFAVANAQSFSEIFNASHNTFSEVDNDLEGSNIKSIKTSISKAYLQGPPIELGKLRIIYNLEHKWYHNQMDSKDGSALFFAENLHDTRLTTIFNYKLNDKWALNYVNFSTLKSDYKGFDLSNAYKGINALTVGLHPNGNDDLRLGLGITRSKEMGETLIIPVPFLYLKTEKWLVDLMYPRLNVFHKPAQRFEYGLMVNYDIGAFDVSFDEDLIADMPIKPEYQTISNLTITPQINYYLTNNISIYARAGINMLSEVGLMDGDFNDIDHIGYEAKDIPFGFGFGLLVKVPH